MGNGFCAFCPVHRRFHFRYSGLRRCGISYTHTSSSLSTPREWELIGSDWDGIYPDIWPGHRNLFLNLLFSTNTIYFLLFILLDGERECFDSSVRREIWARQKQLGKIR